MCFPHSQLTAFLLISLRIQEQPRNHFLMFPSPDLPPTCISTHFFSFAPDTWHHLSLLVLPMCTGCQSFSLTLGLSPVIFLFPFRVIICSRSLGLNQSVYSHTEIISLLKVLSPSPISSSSQNPFLLPFIAKLKIFLYSSCPPLCVQSVLKTLQPGFLSGPLP